MANSNYISFVVDDGATLSALLSTLSSEDNRSVVSTPRKDGSYSVSAPSTIANTLQSINQSTAKTNALQTSLKKYAWKKVKDLRSNLRTYSLPSDVSVKCDATNSTESDLRALNNWGVSNPTLTQNFTDNDGVVVVITGLDGKTLYTDVLLFISLVMNAYGQVVQNITSGTFTTTDQIDNFNWPS